MGKETVNETVSETKKLDIATKTRRCAIFMADCYALAESLGEEDRTLKVILEATASHLYRTIGEWTGATVAVNNCDKGLKKL